jgi:1,4-dihydroxy-2-naphthoate octaprenyltransferase
VTVLAIVTALFIQIFSNFANDYGDSQKGTDNQHRVGPNRTVQSGEISPQQMKVGMIVLILLSLTTGIWLIAEGTKGLDSTTFLLFLAFGVVALIAAYRYTAGSNPYGYAGFGDIAVFLFFGILPVAGTYFLNSHQLSAEIFLPALSIGFFSTGVLNLNNMRDEESDRKSNKNTLVVQKGGAWAKKYHFFLIISAMVLMLLFAVIFDFSYRDPNPENFNFDIYFFLIAYIPLVAHLKRVAKNKEPKLLDPELKKLALSTFLLSILLSLSLIYFISDLIIYYTN